MRDSQCKQSATFTRKYIEAALPGQSLIRTGEGGVDLIVVEWARHE